MLTMEFRAMNTAIVLAAEDVGSAAEGLEAARALIEQSEARFSRFLPDSELTRLNRSAGRWHDVSEDLLDILRQCREYFEETGGLFDPSILADLQRVGYDKSMDDIRQYGVAAPALPHLGQRPDFRQVEIDIEQQRVRLPAGMGIDLGGIAKGWIVERAAQLLHAHTTAAAVSAGGDIVFKGYPLDGSGWRVVLEDPRDPTKTVAEIQMGPGSIVTSSVTKRSWNQAGIRRHHLIDPRTGEPAITDWLSVTVIAPSITTAEVYAKSLLIGGGTQASRIAARRPEISYYTVSHDGTLARYPSKVECINELQ